MSGIGDSVYPQLEAALVGAIPPAVKALGFSEQVYCLRVYYDGTDTPGDHYVTRMRLVTEATRQEIIAKRGGKAPYYFWGADETDMPKHGIDVRLDNDPNVRSLCQQTHAEGHLFSRELLKRQQLRCYRPTLQIVANQCRKWQKLTVIALVGR